MLDITFQKAAIEHAGYYVSEVLCVDLPQVPSDWNVCVLMAWDAE